MLESMPWVDGVGFADDVDFLRGIWDEEEQAMIVTLKRWCGEARDLVLRVNNLPSGRWAIYLGGELSGSQVLAAGGNIEIVEAVGKEEVDVIVARVG